MGAGRLVSTQGPLHLQRISGKELAGVGSCLAASCEGLFFTDPTEETP